MKRSGLKFPRRQCGFHLFCHTYATWMHRYNGLDNYGLARTGRWKDPRSAEIYIHTEVGEEADNLPMPIRAERTPLPTSQIGAKNSPLKC
jgi:hypothetical protein